MSKHRISDAATLSGWRKSSHSSSQGDSCVEVLDGYANGVPVRDSKNPHGPALVFGSAAWSAFVAGMKAGDFGA